MAKTIIGTFDETYHHIDAPTKVDEEFREKHKTWKRIIEPSSSSDWADPNLEHIADAQWDAKRKYDGTNIRIKWDGEQAIVAGKTNKANVESYIGLQEYVDKYFQEEVFEELFGREKTVTLFGEWMGPKVQTNELKLEKPELVLFDVKINNTYLCPDDVCDVANKLRVKSYREYQDYWLNPRTLRQWIRLVSLGCTDWEGIVVEPCGQFRDRAGRRIIYKIKNHDYNVQLKEVNEQGKN